MNGFTTLCASLQLYCIATSATKLESGKYFESNYQMSRSCVVKRESSENSSGGSRRIGRYLFVYGFDDQNCFEGPFSGLQCTSTALAALIFWAYRGRPRVFTRENVNEILIEGYILHCRLRLELKLSNEEDGMVAIYDLPTYHFLELGEIWGMPVRIRLAQEAYPVLTTRSRDVPFPSLAEFLVTYQAGVPMPFLITIDCFTYAIIRFSNDTWVIFDSHGHLRIRGCALRHRAGFLLCSSLKDLQLVFTGMYGVMCQCEVAPIDLGLPSDRVKPIVEEKGIEDESPYVSFMGCRDD